MDFLLLELLQYLGTPYKWGGSNPVEGFDCSGFVQWVLKSSGSDPKGDQTAQALYNELTKKRSPTNQQKLGTIVFYGESVTKITHVAIAIDPYRVIEAGGGDSLTITREDAAKANACVRIRLVNARNDLVARVHPDYSKIGVI